MGPNPGRGVSGSMRRLHVVGYAADLGGFLLAARKGAKSGSYFLALDDTLLEELEQARRGEDHAAPEAPPAPVQRSGTASGLTPREIQSRLRSGCSIEEVAIEAGVGPEWVERFAAPIFAEQAAAVERAGRAVLHTPRKGSSDRPLEASVRRNLAERGLVMREEEFQDAWSARHVIDTDWLVTFRFRSRGRPMTAEWMLNLASGALTTRNRLGADLGYIDPGGGPAAAAVAAGSADGAPRRPLADGKGTAKRARLGPATAPKGPAARAGAAEAPARKEAVGNGRAGKTAAGKDSAGTTAARKASAGKTAPARKASVRQLPLGPAAEDPPAVSRPPDQPRRVAAAPREAPASLSISVTGQAESSRPAGAHFARRSGSPPARAQSGPANARTPVTGRSPAAGAEPVTKGAPAKAPRPVTGGSPAARAEPVTNGAPATAAIPVSRGANGGSPARPGRPLRAGRAQRMPDPLEPPRLPLGDFDETPDTGGLRPGTQD